MNQRPSSRKSKTNGQQCNDNNNLSRIVEEESDIEHSECYSRYDPKELRDAARILSPFLRLTDDVNNPYARLVAQEVCETFHSLFYPNKDPVDVMKSFNTLLKSQKSIQVWNEFWLYATESRYKEWVPLRKESLIEINDECDPCPPRDTADCDPCPPRDTADCDRAEQQKCPDSGNFIRRRSKSNRKPTQNRGHVSYDDTCGSDSYPNLCDISPPANMCDDSYPNLCDVSPPPDMCDVQFAAGTDSSPVTRRPRTEARQTEERRKRVYGADPVTGRAETDDVERDRDDHDEACSDGTSEDETDGDETDDGVFRHARANRQHAGNDVYLPYCKPGRSTDPDYPVSDYVENPAQYEYYRVTGNSPSQRRNVNDHNVLQAIMARSPVEPELRTNALDHTEVDGECDDDSGGSAESVVSAGEIECKAKMVASAFATISLAQRELDKKKSAFEMLTKNYLNYASNPIDADPPCAGTTSARKMLKAIYKNPPNVLIPFDNSEWNDNCFRDRDFVRLLPFYEIVHNQLEYISKTQRDYGVNMLDDIISVFYHIHYDLGDPRLKNEMLIEHVKLVTKNTWESYFYPGTKKMPAIPEKPDLNCPPSPLERSMSQHLSPVQLSSRKSSPKPPNRVPPALRQVCPKPPKQERPPSCSDRQSPPKNQKPRPCTATDRRPQEDSCNRASDVLQQTENPPVETKRSFLRRSRPSGAPKGWAPKLKAVERPKEVKTFKAKPLPKFVRDRLNSRDENC